MLAELEIACTRIATSNVHSFSWEWDERFHCALTTFPIEKKDAVVGMVKGYFPRRWDNGNIAQAPATTKRLTENLGGIYPGQELYSGIDENGHGGLVAFWPWGNGQTVSIRVLPPAASLCRESEGLTERFKSWFGIHD